MREVAVKLPDEAEEPEVEEEIDEIISEAEEEGIDLGEETL